MSDETIARERTRHYRNERGNCYCGAGPYPCVVAVILDERDALAVALLAALSVVEPALAVDYPHLEDENGDEWCPWCDFEDEDHAEWCRWCAFENAVYAYRQCAIVTAAQPETGGDDDTDG